MVLFMVFGDGEIDKQGRLVVRNSIRQKDYIEWKRQMLKKNGVNTTNLELIKRGNKSFYEFSTCKYKFIQNMGKYICFPYKKIASQKQLNKINELGLCIWYLDKGGLIQLKDKQGN